MSDLKSMLNQEARTRHRIEIQSRQIERVFNRHQIAAEVAGGRIRPRQTQFDLKLSLAAGWERLNLLRGELMQALQTERLKLGMDNGRLQIFVGQEAPPVRLLDLMEGLTDLPTMTAVLGLTEDDQPVVLHFDPITTPHLLIVGDSGAGKTVLMRTIAISLALANRQSKFQFIAIDPDMGKKRTKFMSLEPLSYLPHILTAVNCHQEEILETLSFLLAEMDYRADHKNTNPKILVLVDNAAELLEMSGEPVKIPIQQLLQRGAEVGIHLVLSTSKPQSKCLDELVKSNLSMHIFGRLEGENANQAAADGSVIRADYLLGKGDFVAVSAGGEIYFQAAFIGDYDQHHCLQVLHRQHNQVLVAQSYPLNGNGHWVGPLSEMDSQPFLMDAEAVTFVSYESERQDDEDDGLDLEVFE